jgi:cell division protein FtsX
MRSNFVFQEIWVGLRRNLTMTVALVVVVAISLSTCARPTPPTRPATVR